MKNILIALLLLFSNAFTTNPLNKITNRPRASEAQKARDLYLNHKIVVLDELSQIFNTYGVPEKKDIEYIVNNIMETPSWHSKEAVYQNNDSIVINVFNMPNDSEYSINFVYFFNEGNITFFSAGLFLINQNTNNLLVGGLFFPNENICRTGVFDVNYNLIQGEVKETPIGINPPSEFQKKALVNFSAPMISTEHGAAHQESPLEIARSIDSPPIEITSSSDSSPIEISSESERTQINALWASADQSPHEKFIKSLFPMSVAGSLKIALTGTRDDSDFVSGSIFATYQICNPYNNKLQNISRPIGTYTRICGLEKNYTYKIDYTPMVLNYMRKQIIQTTKEFQLRDIKIIDCAIRCFQSFGLLNDEHAITYIYILIDNDSIIKYYNKIYAGFPMSFQ